MLLRSGVTRWVPRRWPGVLKDHGYSLQANAKKLEGAQHPDRDAQFGYLNAQVSAFLDAGEPVISVDSKKKENVGTYSNGGAEYAPKGEPEATNTYDFIGEAGKVAPYGVYDLAANTGWVNVGTDADTGAFAVESIRRWWAKIGHPAYPDAKALLITADGGGSNGGGCGRPNWASWPPRPVWRSPCATCHWAPPNGTKSSTGCSPRSP